LFQILDSKSIAHHDDDALRRPLGKGRGGEERRTRRKKLPAI
jgi:hypothetical protein